MFKLDKIIKSWIFREFMDNPRMFIFLYPQEEIFMGEIQRGCFSYSFKGKRKLEKDLSDRIEEAETKEEKEKRIKDARQVYYDKFRDYYSKKLNLCINQRYRKNGFSIFYAILDDCEVSSIIGLKENDYIIKVGMDSVIYRTLGCYGKYHNYPDNDYILDQLVPLNVLRIGGFHLWDCVEKLAKRAYERQINVLVDEDLTESFVWRFKDKNFKIDHYQSYDPRKLSDVLSDSRENKPWLLHRD